MSLIAEGGYPDLVLISPTGKKYDYDTFESVDDSLYELDEDGNRYTGYEVNPEIMEIDNPESGIWKVGTYPSSEIDVTYLLISNLNIEKK